MTTYDDYGRSGGSAPTRFGFTGHVTLAEAGLVHMRARAYDPGTGRFLSPDPIGYGDGPNIYAYAGGDPVNRVDPWGLADKGMGPNPWVKPIFPMGDQKVGLSSSSDDEELTSTSWCRGISCDPFVFQDPFIRIELVLSQFSFDKVLNGRGTSQTQAEKDDDVCNKPLYQHGKKLADIGSSISNVGLGLAILGLPFVGVGATPGLVIASFGGAVSALGAAEQLAAGSETAFARALFDAAGGKVFNLLADSSVGQEVLGQSYEAIMDSALPDGCKQ